MELKLDVKTLVIGIAIGVAVTAVIGAGSADQSEIVALPSFGAGGSALVKTTDEGLFIINPNNGMAFRVLQAPVGVEVTNNKIATRGKPFFLNAPSQPKNATGQGY